MLVDGTEQEKIEVAGADEFGEFVAVFEEEKLNQAAEGVKTADEEEVFVLRPPRDVIRSREDRPVKRDQDPQPDHLDRDLHEEVAPKRQLPIEGVISQRKEQARITAEFLEHVSASVCAIVLEPEAIKTASQDHEDHRPDEFEEKMHHECPARDLSQKDHRGKIREILKRQGLQDRDPWLGKQVERKHVSRHEEVQRHDDIK